MLMQTVVDQEVGMSEQRLLFELHLRPWVAQLWEKVDPKTRGEVVWLLAEMGRASLSAQRKARREEGGDESR
jgi:TorA maturation chaperone TorD